MSWNRKIEHSEYGEVLLIKDQNSSGFYVTVLVRIDDQVLCINSHTLESSELRDAIFEDIGQEFIGDLLKTLNRE